MTKKRHHPKPIAPSIPKIVPEGAIARRTDDGRIVYAQRVRHETGLDAGSESILIGFVRSDGAAQIHSRVCISDNAARTLIDVLHALIDPGASHFVCRYRVLDKSEAKAVRSKPAKKARK